NLMMAGVVFSGQVDTDVVSDYGLFSARCRREDIADMKRLGVQIDLRRPHLEGNRTFPDWPETLEKLTATATALTLNNATFYVPAIGSVNLALKPFKRRSR